MAVNSYKNSKRQPLYPSKLFPFFLTLVLMIFVFGTSAFIAYQTGKTRQDKPSKITEECMIGGCNSELCSEASEDLKASICLYEPKFECYNTATCEKQINGKCGWTQTEELTRCLTKAGTTNSEENSFCGGFAGITCPEGYTCKLDGNYPDAGGKCIKRLF